MVLTPQLLQAIKLLQMPNAELSAFIENELSSNPILERAEDHEPVAAQPIEASPPEPALEIVGPGDWASDSLETDAGALAANLGTDLDNAFDADRTAPAETPWTGEGLSVGTWGAAAGGAATGGDAPDLEAYVAEVASLSEHLHRQCAILLPRCGRAHDRGGADRRPG